MIGTQTAQRAPTHAAPIGITIGDIERQVLALRANWPLDAELRELALLFAVLKEGSSIGKLMRFTQYDKLFISAMTEDLGQHNKLVTGTLSEHFLLKMLPGSEQLIAEITGGRPVTAPKENPLKDESFDDPDNHGDDADPLPPLRCVKDIRCSKANNHLGRCKTTATPSRAAKAKQIVKTMNETMMHPADASEPSLFFTLSCKVGGEKYEATGDELGRLKKALATVEGMLQ